LTGDGTSGGGKLSIDPGGGGKSIRRLRLDCIILFFLKSLQGSFYDKSKENNLGHGTVICTPLIEGTLKETGDNFSSCVDGNKSLP
jgi:hypothetical protein